MLAVSVQITFGLLVLGAVLTVVRLLRGPSLPDRVVALDLVQVLAVALGALFSVESGKALYLDVSVALALIGFLGAVAFARYAEYRYLDRQDAGEGEQ